MISVENTSSAPLHSDARAVALRGSPLFGEATDVEIVELAQSCRIETFAASTIVLKEGDEPDDLYLLHDGEVLVYSHDDLGRQLALARLSASNEPIGEQAFVSSHVARRSASARAITASRLLRVPGAAFRDLLQRDHALGKRLRELGAQQIREKVMQQMALLRRLVSPGIDSAGLREKTFPDGAVVCQQGTLGQELYVVLSGSARVFRTEADGSIVQLAHLPAGQSFGELGPLEGKPRSATVVAAGELRVLTIGAEDFRRAYHADEHVHGHVAALRSIYSYGGTCVAVQFTAELFERPALATLYRLDDDRTVIAHRIIGQDIWSIQQTDTPADAVQHSFVESSRQVERNLLISGGVVVGAVVKGPWPGISEVHGLVLKRTPLSPAQIDAFRNTGELVDAPSLVPCIDPVICQCMGVARSTLVDAVEDGSHTVQALSMHTGAGTVCGGCLPQLAELTADTSRQTVRCLEVIDRAPRVKSFRFELPERHPAGAIKPGQRIVLQARIGGVDVQRPYTLTSPVTERNHYEITVQREPHGVMSAWLFDHLHPGDAVSILPPFGPCSFELADARPLVCVVGGIGVTPALAVARSAAATGAQRRVHIDYSVSSRDQIVCPHELGELSSQYPTITQRIRITREEGRLQAADLSKLAHEFPDADWLICGSMSFHLDVQTMLLQHGVAAHRIHIESFDAVSGGPAGEPATAILSPKQRTLVSYALIAAMAAFVLQASFDVKWPVLDRLQTSITYSALTGVGLLVLLTLQWHLGYVRWRNRARETSRAYGLHIAIGPAFLGMMWLHSTHFGYALSLLVSVSFLASLTAGALLGAYPRSERWERTRRIVLGTHIVLSCVGSGLALTHGFTALWY
jgi:ferredoxin-NADP reductase/CRP-like cAMP-binding protein